ncbi:MAG: type II toxin-antitoxin system prevent-host-death family antitoxin [Coriobacteriia bacterium]
MLIKPSTAIRQDYTGMAELCHSIDEPVVLTRNGEADLVVMSYEAYRRAEARVKLQARLIAADRQAGDPTSLLDATSVFDRIRTRIDGAEA